MRLIKAMIIVSGLGLVLTSCGSKTGDPQFKYSIDEFADIEVLRYQIPGWEDLSLQQKEYIYHLCEAAKSGRDITWDQNFAYNLEIRHLLENILENYEGERKGEEWDAFLVYAKRVFFSNGIHHHYANDKILPGCSRAYFTSLAQAVGADTENMTYLFDVIFDPDLFPTQQYQGTDKDLVQASAVNFYDGVTAQEVNDFYAKMEDPNDPHPISYGLNSKLVKEDGKIVELTWKADGLYGPAIETIIGHLEAAREVAENDIQKKYIDELVDYYRTGDLRMWDQYNITWVGDTQSDVDFVNGFVEDYDDPLGRKASWEGIVNFRDREASKRTELISGNAQWFEDHSPIDPRFKKKEVKGVSAKVINVAVIAGDNYPATAIGINLPNADWIRKEHGSKSVTIANITDAYALASEQRPKSVLSEFAWDQAEIDLCKQYGNVTDNLHTDLHECLGHGSGQLLPGTPANALKEFTSTLEEARADLFGLYYMADPKLVELGLLDSPEAYKASYMSYIRNGIMTQFSRVELGKQNTEAHMQNRKLIADWCYEHGQADNVIEKKVRDGKTYFVVNDFEKLRGFFGELLAEIQRIKSEGDYEAGKALVLKYAVNIDPELHKEVLSRYASLGLKPYRGFINPDIVPVVKDGKVVDYKIVYGDDFLLQQLQYGKQYRTL
ncbi:MAG: dihydrofolate reductase [Bacteroidales bacterium]|nr:dihydrofolate reductase [Bacteroidales bacterium]